MPGTIRPDPPLSAKEFADIVRSKALDSHVRLRAYAVFLVSQGLPIREVGEIIGVSPKSIRRWVKLWNEHGLDGLASKKREEENQL